MTAPLEYDQFESLRTPPRSVEAEQSVIGSLLMDNEAFKKVRKLITADDFYTADHKKIFSIIEDLFAEEKPIDFITVNDRLDKSDLGLSSYLYTMAKDTPSAANVVGYAEIVKEKSVLRQLIGAGADIQSLAYQSDCVPAKEKAILAQDSIIKIVQDSREAKSRMILPKQMLKGVLAKWKRVNSGGSLMGLKTSFAQLDEVTQGLGKGWLVVVAGRPKMGKTSFASALAHSILSDGKSVGMISMEMPESELVERDLSFMSGVPLSQIRSGQVVNNETQLSNVSMKMGVYKDYKYFVDDSGGQTPQQIRDSVTNMNNESIKLHGQPLAAVIVDYIQIMRPDGKSQGMTEDVTEFSSQLKRLAKDFKIPVIALSQLNRELEKRPNKRPIMSDLRNSGAIEQDADLILFLYRDEVYNEKTKYPNSGEIIMGAFRHGQPKTIMAGWEGSCTKWFDKYPDSTYEEFEE